MDDLKNVFQIKPPMVFYSVIVYSIKQIIQKKYYMDKLISKILYEQGLISVIFSFGKIYTRDC